MRSGNNFGKFEIDFNEIEKQHWERNRTQGDGETIWKNEIEFNEIEKQPGIF